MRRIGLLCSVLLVVFIPLTGAASTFTLKLTHYDSVTVNYTYNGTKTTNGIASKLDLQLDFSDKSSFTTWGYCVEIGSTISPNVIYSSYSLWDLDKLDDNLAAQIYAVDAGYKAAWLANTYQGLTTGAERAGLQLAIWDAVYFQNNSLDRFVVLDTTNDAIEGYYITYINALSTLTTLNKPELEASFDIAHSDVQQDLIIHNPVPVPAAVWLLGSGLVALIGIRRKPGS